MRHFGIVIGLLAIAATGVSGRAHAPKTTPGTGVLRGRVTDELGKPLQWVNVTVEHASTGGQTGVRGDYLIPNVPAGTYTVRVSMVGFARTNQDSVQVGEHKTTTVDFRLEPGPTDVPKGWVD